MYLKGLYFGVFMFFFMFVVVYFVCFVLMCYFWYVMCFFEGDLFVLFLSYFFFFCPFISHIGYVEIIIMEVRSFISENQQSSWTQNYPKSLFTLFIPLSIPSSILIFLLLSIPPSKTLTLLHPHRYIQVLHDCSLICALLQSSAEFSRSLINISQPACNETGNTHAENATHGELRHKGPVLLF